MKSGAILLLVTIVCFCSGCAKYYYQEGRSFGECAADRADCMSELKKRLAVESKRPGGYEYKFMEECMKGKGYRLVTEGKLPLDAKRKDPDSSLRGVIYGQRRGIAGTVDEE
jgi:hypothetical protein